MTGILQYQLQNLCSTTPHRNYLLSLSMRLCLSLRWAIPSWIPLCICRLELDCAACQGPWAAVTLWLPSRVFWISLRGLRSMFGSNGLILLQLLLFSACLHKLSSWEKTKRKRRTYLWPSHWSWEYFCVALFMWNNRWSFIAHKVLYRSWVL